VITVDEEWKCQLEGREGCRDRKVFEIEVFGR